MDILTFVARGIPQPQGSTKAFGSVILDSRQKDGLARNKRGQIAVATRTTSDNPQLKGWRSTVHKAAWNALMDLPASERRRLSGPVRVDVVFYLRAPQDARPAEDPHLTKPDLDKLLRAVLDSLTGQVWGDDCQVTDTHARKQYAMPGEERAEITVAAIPLGLFAVDDGPSEETTHGAAIHRQPGARDARERRARKRTAARREPREDRGAHAQDSAQSPARRGHA